MSKRIEQSQIEEWIENPVTIALKDLLEAELEHIQEAKASAFHPFEPQTTHEVLAGLNGAEDTWELVLGFLDGDWSYLEEDDDE